MAEGNIRLIVPRIIPFEEFYGVWIRNTGLEPVGLTPGVFALAIRSEIKQGDLAAFLLIESDMVALGFYSQLCGAICLENCNSDVELFNRNEVEYFGKIVGYGDKPVDMTMAVHIKPILLEDFSYEKAPHL
mgnify:CR=1 FL=1